MHPRCSYDRIFLLNIKSQPLNLVHPQHPSVAPVVHEIDPDADTVIILRSPGDGEYFAWWDDSPFDNLDILDQLPFSMKEWDTKMSISDDIEVHQSPARAFITKELDWVILNVPEGSVLYLVSSRHLELASPVFKAALSPGTWSEGCKQADGRYHITADDWEEEAFLLFMNMLHLRSPQIPKTVSLELMAKLGILIDYYNCASAVEFFTSVWMNKIYGDKMEGEYCRESILLLWVFYLFGSKDCVALLVEIMTFYCNESKLRTLGLPIPQSLSDEIEHRRHELINKKLSYLHYKLTMNPKPNEHMPDRLRETLRRTIGGQRRSSGYPYLEVTVVALTRVLLDYSQEQVEAILELEATRIEWYRANGFELCWNNDELSYE
ncbi:hypothetical protein J4E85_010453 [Alternaria conjuncta]|uniref:uncharacterized protein n=1 Tax=Alternaria conjuncta TaxID=181017 RepID=UPI0022207948|nr:uncharacterized protein J4E85_010453 [Alternaria conjuncta]KAI4915328.1 hypothetical protein J4E85_010453 [Alternaria conjuncta]